MGILTGFALWPSAVQHEMTNLQERNVVIVKGGRCMSGRGLLLDLWAGIEIIFTMIVAKLVDGSALIFSDLICDLYCLISGWGRDVLVL
jgi:hypothetical protein